MQRDMHSEEVDDPVLDGNTTIWRGLTMIEIVQWIIVGCVAWGLNEAIDTLVPGIGNARLMIFTVLVGGGIYFIHNRKTNNLVGWQRVYLATRYRAERELHHSAAAVTRGRGTALPTTKAATPKKAKTTATRTGDLVTASADSGTDQ